MPKGTSDKLVTRTCQYCEKTFETIQYRRKSCPECIPDGQNKNLALIRRLIKTKAVKYKGGKCEQCGLEADPCVYDFHHVDPLEKEFSLGEKTSTTKWDLIKEELDKCQILCAVCHRLEHNK